MNKLLKIISVTVIAAMLAAASALGAAPQIKVGEKYTNSKLHLKPDTYVLQQKNEDVTGDAVKDQILLVGVKENKEAIFNTNMNIIVQDGKTGQYTQTPIGAYPIGYEGQLFIGDFNGDKIPDVMASTATGGSGGVSLYSIFTFKDNKPAAVFDQEKLSAGVQFEGCFLDGYRAEILSKDLNKKVIIDISAGKEYYQEANVYDKDGKLLTPTECVADGYGLLEPVDYDGDGTYELRGYQRIWGVCHADTISNAQSLWKFTDNGWKPEKLELSTFLIK